MRTRLNNYVNLINERLSLLSQLSKLEYAIENYEATFTGGGIGTVHSNGVSFPTENAAIEHLSFEENVRKDILRINKRLDIVNAELLFLDTYIDSISDSYLRGWFDWRYRKGETWRSIARNWNYAPSSWKVIQKKVYDYINQHQIP